MASQTIDTVTLISPVSQTVDTVTLIPPASALTTYTSYSTSTFVSGGTTYKLSTGVPVIVTNSAELSTLSAAGAFQTATPSSEVAGGSIKTVTGIWVPGKRPFEIMKVHLASSFQRLSSNIIVCFKYFHSSWRGCRCGHWHSRRRLDPRPHRRDRLVLTATEAPKDTTPNSEDQSRS
jgi:hypothetical protein